MAMGMLNILDRNSRNSHDSLGTCQPGERSILFSRDSELVELEPHSTLELCLFNDGGMSMGLVDVRDTIVVDNDDESISLQIHDSSHTKS